MLQPTAQSPPLSADSSFILKTTNLAKVLQAYSDIKRRGRSVPMKTMSLLLAKRKLLGRSLLCVVLLAVTTNVKADSFAYAVGGAGTLETVDLNTGASTVLSVTPCSTSAGPGITACVGLGVNDGTLFLLQNTATGANLYSVNPTNGSTNLIGSGGFTVASFGSTTNGLFLLDTSGNLYSVLSTGLTLLGSTGISPTRNEGLSDNSSTLYFSDAGELYTLNTTTGAASSVGATGSAYPIGDMLYENGTLYAIDAPGDAQSGEIFTINTTTGAATDTGINDGRVVSGGGLAPYPLPAATPEPGTLSLMLTGLGSLGMMFVMRKRITRGLPQITR
jgi:hypothetical protein